MKTVLKNDNGITKQNKINISTKLLMQLRHMFVYLPMYIENLSATRNLEVAQELQGVV